MCDGNDKFIEMLKFFVCVFENLIFKKNVKVMFVKNNFDVGYINGSLGEVVGFEEDDDFGILLKVKLIDGMVLVVEFEMWLVDNDVGKIIVSF